MESGSPAPKRQPPKVGSSRATLSDVAREVGLSRTTVSFAINGRDDMRISDDARLRVIDAASRLGYRPNVIAQSLRTSRTRTIAFVSDSIATDHYAGAMVRGAVTAAARRGHLMLIAETGGDADVEHRVIADFVDRRVDGFVYASSFTREVALPRELHDQPVVFLNCMARSADEQRSAVVPDERAAGRHAVALLAGAGHRTVYLVGESTATVYAARERLAGVRAELRKRNMTLGATIECSWWPEPARDAVGAFLATRGRVGTSIAFVCMNDRIAFGAYQASAGAGLAIPGDVSIVSFDDSDLATWLHPKLTSIALPHFDLGAQAIETLLSERRAPHTKRLAMPVAARDSVADVASP